LKAQHSNDAEGTEQATSGSCDFSIGVRDTRILTFSFSAPLAVPYGLLILSKLETKCKGNRHESDYRYLNDEYFLCMCRYRIGSAISAGDVG
jgi:hypothetical protein